MTPWNFDTKPEKPTLFRDRGIALRVELDALHQAIPQTSIHLRLARNRLEVARMWIGNCLQLADPSADPYRPSEAQRVHGNSQEIAPRADTSSTPLVLPPSAIDSCDVLRGALREAIIEAKSMHLFLVERNDPDGFWIMSFMEEVVKGLTLVYNTIGLELGRLRDETPRDRVQEG